MTDVVRTAVLEDYPLRIWHRQQEYTADLIREFQLLVVGQEMAQHEVPARLLGVADMFLTRYSTLIDALTTARHSSRRRGTACLDPVGGAPAVPRWAAEALARILRLAPAPRGPPALRGGPSRSWP